MSIELPRVLENGSYTRRLHPISCSVYQSLAPLSTANMDLPTTDEIHPFDWVQIFTPDGKSEYYRVESVSTNVVTGDQTVYLEHGACTLGDIIIPDVAVDAQTSSQTSHGANLKEYPENMTDTIGNIIDHILNKQPNPKRWTRGTIEATETIYIELGGFTLLSSLSSVMQYIPDYQLEFVQNDNSWTVNIKHRPTTVICEGRLSRNLTSCDVSYSTANIVTRVYSDGVSGGYVDSANKDVYGLHEETMTMSENLEPAQKLAIIQSYLRNHDHPTVSVTISGVELSQVTGLQIDEFKVGSVCRIAIPWLNITEEQVIIDKNYSDCYNFPEEVTITLANATPDLVIAMAAITSTVSGGGGGMGGGLAAEQAQKEKEKKRYETRLEQTDEYFRFIATDTQWDDMGNGTLTGYGQFVLTHNSFQLVVDNVGEGSIDAGTATITPVTIAGSINEEGSNALINADHIYLNATQEITLAGMVQVNGTTFQIEEGVNGDGTLTCNTIECYNLEVDGEISTNGLILNSGATFQVDGDSVSWKSATVITGIDVTMPSITRSNSRAFMYAVNGDTTNPSTVYGTIITSYNKGSVGTPSTVTLNYLGK